MGSPSLQSTGQGQVTRPDHDGADTGGRPGWGRLTVCCHSKWPEVLYLVTGLGSKYTKQERGLEVVGRLRHFVSGD